ncbi:MAG: hypothetical protein ACPG7F_07990 [Aggregatilineales bacterium]
MALKGELKNKIKSFLIKHLDSESARKSLIDDAFYEYPDLYNQIEFNGNTTYFTTRLIQTCERFGYVDEDTKALVLLLQTIHKSVGVRQKAYIDSLIQEINKDSSPLNDQKITFDTVESDISTIPEMANQKMPFFLIVGMFLMIMIIGGLLIQAIVSPDNPQPDNVATTIAEITDEPIETQTATKTSTSTLEPSATFVPINTSVPTATLTNTPLPTSTAIPTATLPRTPRPTSTPNPTSIHVRGGRVDMRYDFDDERLKFPWYVWNEEPEFENGEMIFSDSGSWGEAVIYPSLSHKNGILMSFEIEHNLIPHGGLSLLLTDPNFSREIGLMFNTGIGWYLNTFVNDVGNGLVPFYPLEREKYYYLAIIGDDGEFYFKIWEQDGPGRIILEERVAPTGSGWDSSRWQLVLKAQAGTLRIDWMESLIFDELPEVGD